MIRSLTLVCLLVSSVRVSAEPVHQPVGKWVVDYDEAQCLASAEYGTDKEPLTLILKPSPLDGVMRVVVMRSRFAEVHEFPAKVQFDTARPVQVSGLSYSDDVTHRGLISINMPMASFRAGQQSQVMTISGGLNHYKFAVPQLPQVLAALDKCVDDLQQYWNIGKIPPKIVSEAVPQQPLNRLFSPGDYPSSALYKQEYGAVRVVFLVNEQGKVSDCSVEVTSGVPALDLMSCYVLQSRATFSPAEAPDGKPIRSGYCQDIRWILSTVPQKPPADPRCPSHPWSSIK